MEIASIYNRIPGVGIKDRIDIGIKVGLNIRTYFLQYDVGLEKGKGEQKFNKII